MKTVLVLVLTFGLWGNSTQAQESSPLTRIEGSFGDSASYFEGYPFSVFSFEVSGEWELVMRSLDFDTDLLLISPNGKLHLGDEYWTSSKISKLAVTDDAVTSFSFNSDSLDGQWTLLASTCASGASGDFEIAYTGINLLGPLPDGAYDHARLEDFFTRQDEIILEQSVESERADLIAKLTASLLYPDELNLLRNSISEALAENISQTKRLMRDLTRAERIERSINNLLPSLNDNSTRDILATLATLATENAESRAEDLLLSTLDDSVLQDALFRLNNLSAKFETANMISNSFQKAEEEETYEHLLNEIEHQGRELIEHLLASGILRTDIFETEEWEGDEDFILVDDDDRCSAPVAYTPNVIPADETCSIVHPDGYCEINKFDMMDWDYSAKARDDGSLSELIVTEDDPFSLAGPSLSTSELSFLLGTSPTSNAKGAFDASVSLPQILPWPPPEATHRVVIQRGLLGPNTPKKLGDVADVLADALHDAGYVGPGYMGVPSGFAIVTPIEQIEISGAPVAGEDRWSTRVDQFKAFSLASYLKALFTATPGYYRVIVLIVTDTPFAATSARDTLSTLQRWSRQGLNALSTEVRAQPYSEDHALTALIYEFRKASQDSDPLVTVDDPIPATNHFSHTSFREYIR